MASDSNTYIASAKFNFIHHSDHSGKTTKSKNSDVEQLYVSINYKPDTGRHEREKV